MGIVVYSLALILVFSSAYGRTIDEIIRDAYKNGTGLHNADTVLVEMDMLYPRTEFEDLISGKSSRKGINGEQYRWTDNTVPYTYSSVFSKSQRDAIRKGMDEWESYTCLKMVPRTSQYNYVHIQDDGSGCNSYVGMMRWGMQPMNLARLGCISHATIVHEFGHAIGFIHEHQRPDRDSYVTIQYDNVGDGWDYAFNKYPSNQVDDRDIVYDYLSVMHYGKTAFSDNGYNTIRTHDPYYQDRIGNSPGLVFKDIQLANSLYNCDQYCAVKPKCSNTCYVGKDCKCWCDSHKARIPVCEYGTPGCN